MKHQRFAAQRAFCAWALPAFAAVLLAACGGGSDGSLRQTAVLPSYSSDLADGTSIPQPRVATDGAFATSLLCANCHANADNSDALRDSADRPIAPFDLWRSNVMSNAVRDPLWRAVVSAEMSAAPTMADVIEAKCFSCHGPMASREGELDGVEPTLSMVYEDTDRAQILVDAVSCTVCHQITSAGLGTEDSYTGQFELSAERVAYGPHANPRQMPMLGMSGYRAVQAAHTTESSLCGSCHTVITPVLDADGELTGEYFAEQTSYLEWQNSVFTDEVAAPAAEAAGCGECHMPTLSEDGILIRTALSTKPAMMDGGRGPGGKAGRTRNRYRRGGSRELPDRSPFGRHVLVGANTVIPRMLLANPDELSPNATPENLRATIQSIRNALRYDSARLSVPESSRVGDDLHIQLRVENLVGHKLPAGIPVRRMWLRVRVRDDDGNIVFQSGEHDGSGRILGADGTPLASEEVAGPVVSHRDVITSSDQVQIWESLMADSDGVLTFRLMRAAAFLKDNRLLPLGWSSDHADAPLTAPMGAVTSDANFTAGEDTVSYEITAPASGGPYRLEASLFYQAIGMRYAAELLEYSTPEVEDFERYFTADLRVPEEIVTLSQDVP